MSASAAAARRNVFKVGISGSRLFLLLRRMVAETIGARNPTSGPSVIASAMMACRCLSVSFPRKHRLLKLGDAGVAPRQHLAELVDQRRRRRMDVLAGET